MHRRSGNLATRLGSTGAAASAPWSANPQAAGSRRLLLRAFDETRVEPTAASLTPRTDTRADRLARLEAVLLAAREPLPTRKLAELADLGDGTEARSLVRQLSKQLRKRGSAWRPAEVAGGVQLFTRPELADWVGRVHAPSDELRLSAPALETLAVAVYRQPVTRAEIEAIRGVQCGEILRLLMERDLLRIVGRSEELGRPFLYGPTKKFLQLFGLRRLEQLPAVDQICIASASS